MEIDDEITNNLGETSDNAPNPVATARNEGAYYYLPLDEGKLALYSFLRTLLTAVAFLLQVATLLLPAQAGAIYVSKNIPSYGLLYAFFVIFGILGVSIWLMFMNALRYKIGKRIPTKHTPKTGFTRRVYFGLELYMAITGITAIFELSFVCIKFDGMGMVALILSFIALGAAIGARTIAHIALKNAKLIPSANK